jgi:RES domain-containing protein
VNAYRIADRAWALDATGTGAALHGARWNEMRVPALYAGLSVEIAALEKLVHTAGRTAANLVLVHLRLPDDPAFYVEPDPSTLPANWDVIPPGPQSARYGTVWLEAGAQLGLIVPSAILPEARNIMINPRHVAINEVKLTVMREFAFDSRLRMA